MNIFEYFNTPYTNIKNFYYLTLYLECEVELSMELGEKWNKRMGKKTIWMGERLERNRKN